MNNYNDDNAAEEENGFDYFGDHDDGDNLIDIDEKENYFEDALYKSETEKRFINHRGYIYVKLRSRLLPFLYRKYYCLLSKPLPTGDDESTRKCIRLDIWRSRLNSLRLPFSPRRREYIQKNAYTTEIERVRGVKITYKG